MSDGSKGAPPQLVQKQFDDIMLSLGSLCADVAKISTDGSRAKLLPLLQNTLLALVEQFSKEARDYFALSHVVIAGAKKAEPRIREPYNYGRVLNKLVNHVALLEDMANHALSEAQEQHPEVLEAFIWSAANELSQVPVLIPLRLPQYCFVHFNYVTSVGVIGYTMPALARPPQDVAVLWHEVAGYSVARARGGKLQNWARNLRTALMAEPCSPDSERTSGDTAWDWYRDSFMTSKLDRIPVRLRISSDDNRSRLAVDTSKKIRDYFTIKRQEDAAVYAGAAQPEYVENDNAWQTDWLGEFIEDLYGIRSLGEVYFRTLVSTLLQNYPVLTIGDLKHPAPLLRLQVALCYLRSYNDAKQRSVVEKTLTEFKRDYPGAIGHLQFAADAARDPMAATDLDDFDAAVIAGRKSDNAKREWLQCLQVVANTIARELAVFAEDPILFAPASSRSRSNNAWKDVVAFIQRADKPDSYQGLSRRPDEKLIELVAKVREEYCSAIDGIVKNGVSAEPSSVWIQQGYSRKAGWDFGSAPKNSDEAIAALQRLHAIEFVVTDETGPYTQGQTVVVIPSG